MGEKANNKDEMKRESLWEENTTTKLTETVLRFRRIRYTVYRIRYDIPLQRRLRAILHQS